MGKKDVHDVLTDGIYGTRLPKEEERKKYLGTLRERIVLALTIGQVMTDKGIDALEEAMMENREAKLLLNGQVSTRFLAEEKELANRFNIPYTVITDENSDTNIGAVLTYDYAIDKENIYISEEDVIEEESERESLFSKIKAWFQ